jgi:rhomboid protease GluP
MVAELDPVFTSEEQDELALPPATTKDNIKAFFGFFIPRDGYFITPIIIDINIIVFIVMFLSGVGILEPSTEALLAWGANFRILTLGGQWWRLLTNVFLHIGILHLLLNMYALLYIGILLEPFLGRIRFIVAYLLTGILASLTSIYWHPITISAGASGAIFGMYGVFLAMLTTNFIDKAARKALLVSIGVFVFFNLANGMKAGIDNAAHIGGLVSGLIIGYCYYPSLKKPLNLNFKYITIGVLLIAFLISSIVIYKNIPDDITKYDPKMKAFAKYEALAVDVLNLPEQTPKDQLIAALDNGINNWYQCLKIVNELSKLNLPIELRARETELRKYCQLRIKSYKLLSKAVSEDTTKYNDSVQIYTQQINDILSKLQGDSK